MDYGIKADSLMLAVVVRSQSPDSIYRKKKIISAKRLHTFVFIRTHTHTHTPSLIDIYTNSHTHTHTLTLLFHDFLRYHMVISLSKLLLIQIVK